MQQIVLLLACIDYHKRFVVSITCCNQHGNISTKMMIVTLMTGLLRVVFQKMMDAPSSGSTWSIGHTGRPYSLSPSAELGLFLFYIGSTRNLKHLCLIFGTTPAVCSCSLKNVERNSLHIAQI
jgi:hypothetical protein